MSKIAGVIFTGVLTKAIVKALPDDAFLLSNVSNGDGSPVVVRKVGEQARRGELWEKIRSARLNGRRFYVFADQGWAELVA